MQPQYPCSTAGSRHQRACHAEVPDRQSICPYETSEVLACFREAAGIEIEVPDLAFELDGMLCVRDGIPRQLVKDTLMNIVINAVYDGQDATVLQSLRPVFDGDVNLRP